MYDEGQSSVDKEKVSMEWKISPVLNQKVGIESSIMPHHTWPVMASLCLTVAIPYKLTNFKKVDYFAPVRGLF